MTAARAALPDLDALNPKELKALIISQHELIVSRDSEIEQLKLLIAKLRRMQFGRSSEKLDRQIEQLELRLEALQQNALIWTGPKDTSSLALNAFTFHSGHTVGLAADAAGVFHPLWI